MKKYKILVAEDDAALRNSLRIRLSSEGYEVLCAGDGYYAVAMIVQHLPDLIILDIHMPAGDGFSVQGRISKMVHLSYIPIIFVTGDHSQQVLDAAQNLGARSVLRKPFETAELLRIVREALNPAEGQEQVQLAELP
jgi:CheY-like chemotaxis protein